MKARLPASVNITCRAVTPDGRCPLRVKATATYKRLKGTRPALYTRTLMGACEAGHKVVQVCNVNLPPGRGSVRTVSGGLPGLGKSV